MEISIGIALAFVAMLSWGIGDFFIQKSTRKIGDWESLFFITFFGAAVLFPFVFKKLPEIANWPASAFWVVAALCVSLFAAAILDFEALREGKLAVIEPIWSFEVPVAAFLAFFLLAERVNFLQVILLITLLAGLALVSMRNNFHFRKFLLEKGVKIGFLGAVMMGVANFFMGFGSRVTDPVMANFISDVFIALITGIILLTTGKFKKTIRDIASNKGILLPMSISDKAAWLAFAFAMSMAPIAIAVALSESYIIVAVILGLAINKEKLSSHQKTGLAVAIISAVALAAITV